MLDNFEETDIQDSMFAKALGIGLEEVERLSLNQLKNELHNKAFKLRDNNETLTQEEDNCLNETLQGILYQLIEFDYDIAEDYIINFNSFVKENKYYNKFCW